MAYLSLSNERESLVIDSLKLLPRIQSLQIPISSGEHSRNHAELVGDRGKFSHHNLTLKTAFKNSSTAFVAFVMWERESVGNGSPRERNGWALAAPEGHWARSIVRQTHGKPSKIEVGIGPPKCHARLRRKRPTSNTQFRPTKAKKPHPWRSTTLSRPPQVGANHQVSCGSDARAFRSPRPGNETATESAPVA